MRKSASQRRIRTSICLGVLALTAASSLCQADSDLWTGEYSRKAKWEVYAGGQYLAGDTANFSDTGSLLKLDDAFTGGVGFGYHFLDYLSIDVELFGGPLRLTARDVFSSTIRIDDATLFGGNVNLNYNVLKRRFTPVITAGLGFRNYSARDLNETDPAANVGAGLRWDITDRFFIKAIGGVTWTELQNENFYNLFTGQGSILIKSASLSVGYKF